MEIGCKWGTQVEEVWEPLLHRNTCLFSIFELMKGNGVGVKILLKGASIRFYGAPSHKAPIRAKQTHEHKHRPS